MKDYYDILGIKKNSSQDEIKKAYRNLALKYHPDKNESTRYAEFFKDINEAKNVLLNEEKRREYDSRFVEDRPKRALFGTFRNTTPTATRIKRSQASTPFIKRNNGKRIILFGSLSALFALFIIFFYNKQNQVDRKLTLYNNEPSSEKNTSISDTTSTGGSENSVLIDSKEELKDKPNNNQAGQIAGNKLLKTDFNKLNGAEDAKTTNEQNAEQVAASKKAVVPKESLAKSNKPAITKTNLIEQSLTTEGAKEKPVKSKGTEGSNTHNKKLNPADMQDLVSRIRNENLKWNNKSNCVQIRVTNTSNVKNGFEVATFLQRHGFIISGREIVYTSMEKLNIDASSGCVKITIGNF